MICSDFARLGSFSWQICEELISKLFARIVVANVFINRFNITDVLGAKLDNRTQVFVNSGLRFRFWNDRMAP